MKTVYVDNNATTQVAPEVYRAMVPFFTDNYFNPSSMYEAAKEPADALERSREVVAKALGGVDPDEVLFTSCATESNNAAIYGTVRANRERRHIITTAVEHPAVLESAVVGVADKENLVKPKAYIILKKEYQASDELVAELQQFAKERIGVYKYPHWIEFVTELPKTATGKTQRYKLRQ